MPLLINPNDYGFANAADLAKIAGTLQGEAKVGGNLYDRAAIADVLFNRAYGGDRQFNAYSTYSADGNAYSGAVAQAAVPSQFNVWMPTIAGKPNGAYQSGNEMMGIINNLAADPSSWDSLTPTQQSNVSLNLTALRGVFGQYDPNQGNAAQASASYSPQGGVLRGLTGGATFYSNPKYNSPGQMATHVGLGLNQGVNQGSNVFYAGSPAATRAMAQRMQAFDRDQAATELSVGDDTEGGYRENAAGMLARMAFKGPDLPASGTDVPTPPFRPSDADLAAYAQGLQGSPLDQFSDAITEGLQGAGNAVGDTFSGAGNAIGQGFGAAADAVGGAYNKLFGARADVGPQAFTRGFGVGTAFGGGAANFGDTSGFFPPTPQPLSEYGLAAQPDPIAGQDFDLGQLPGVPTGGGFSTPQFSLPPGFGAPQAPGAVGFASPLYNPSLAQAAPDFGAPDLQGVDAGAGFNPSGFLNAGFGSFGAAPQFGQGAAALSPWTYNSGIQQPGLITGDFGLPQMQGVDTSNLFGTPGPLTGNFDLPQLSPIPGYDGNVAPDAFAGALNPNGFFGAGNGGFGIPGPGTSNGFASAAAPTLGPDAFAGAYGGGFPSVGTQGPSQFGRFSGQGLDASTFGAPGAIGTNPFGGANVGTFGPDQSASTLGPDAFAAPFGGGGFSAPAWGFNGASTPTSGFNGFDASPLGFTGQTVSPGFFGSKASALGPDQFATASDPAAPASDPYGFSGLNFGAGFGAQPQGFYGAPTPAAPSYNPFGGGGFGGGFGNRFGGFGGGFDDLYGFGGAPAASAPSAPDPYGFSGGNFGAGLGAQPQTFGGLFGTGNAPAAPAYNPFGGGIGGFGGFGGGFNVGGGLGATPQSFGGLFGASAAPAAPAPGPFDFGGANVGAGLGATPQDFGSLYGAPAAPAAPPDAGDGSGFGSTPPDLGFGFDPQASENAFLRGQMANNAAMQQAGQAPQASNPNLYPSLFAAIAPTPTNGTSYIAPQPNHAPAPGFSAPVSYAAPQVSLMMAAPQISLPTMNFSGGGFGGLGGFL